MKLLNFVIALSSSLTLTACSTTPTNPNTHIVLEQHKNIAVEPETKHNLARLIKQKDNCLIEFTGNFATGKATEYWLFKMINSFQHLPKSKHKSKTKVRYLTHKILKKSKTSMHLKTTSKPQT